VFRSKKYTSFPTIVEDMQAGNLKATFMLAPLAMVLNRRGTPVKIVHLGHRDGTTLMVRTDSGITDFAGLKGKRIAIPHRYSNQRILVEKMKERFGFGPNDLTLVDYPPPEMPAALKTGQIDAYIVGEPFPAKAEMDGFGKVLYFTKDIWPNFISCVLVVRDDLIASDRALVQELVNGIARSGKWIDSPGEDLTNGVVCESDAPPPGTPGRDLLTILRDGFGKTHRMQAAAIASRKDYYNQDPDLMKFVLSHPPDRVKYTNLIPAKQDFEEIQRYAEKLGYFSFRPVTPLDPYGFEDYCDPSFVVTSGVRAEPR
jgi:NitT/TauT family transport system substrate-binding protein